MAIPGGLSDYELERQRRIEENKKRMEEMGLMRQKTIMESFKVVKRPTQCFKPFVRKEKPAALDLPVRRSRRILGDSAPDYCDFDENDRPVYDDVDELIDLIDRKGYRQGQVIAPPEPSQEQLEQIQQIRCASQGRGSVYDSSAGITCHFCRQKKLCGEENCPRCQHRDINQECIGKTNCSRCHSATGKFCRACLLIRYGETLEDARQKMDEGAWLCPHCYEEEHPDHGWICNSSICMKRRGLKPTGIAIYEAQDRGFKSVAHLLQAQLQKRGPAALNSDASETTTDAIMAGPSSSSQPSGSQPEAGPSGSQEEAAQQQAPVLLSQSGRPLRRAAAQASVLSAASTHEEQMVPGNSTSSEEAGAGSSEQHAPQAAAAAGRRGRPPTGKGSQTVKSVQQGGVQKVSGAKKPSAVPAVTEAEVQVEATASQSSRRSSRSTQSRAQ